MDTAYNENGLASPDASNPERGMPWRVSSFEIQFSTSNTWHPEKRNAFPPEPNPFKLQKRNCGSLNRPRRTETTTPLPTRTPIDAVVTAYVSHIRNVKTAKSAQTDIYYLRDAFGPICDALKITSRKVSAKTKKRPPKPGQDRRRKAAVIAATCFEHISTSDIAAFISGQVMSRGLAPKTANRYREILTRLFNWAMTQNGVRMPKEKNPAAAVERYKEHAPKHFVSHAEAD